jgi:heme/copper-type cytochrome/quinol oxidase subunit 4
MIKNESNVDRGLRLFLGVMFLYMGYAFSSGGVQIVLYIFGVILVFTAATGFCLLYKLLGISTRTEQE